MKQVFVEGAKGIKFRVANLWVEEGKQTPVAYDSMIRKLIKSKSVKLVEPKKNKGAK
jgi:hypothetical protein